MRLSLTIDLDFDWGRKKDQPEAPETVDGPASYIEQAPPTSTPELQRRPVGFGQWND